MDLEEVRKALARLPAVDPAENVQATDLVSVAEGFSQLLRKVGVQQMRNGTDVVSAVKEASARVAEVHEAALQERNRAVTIERQLETLATALVVHLDFLSRALELMRQAGGFETWVSQIEQGRTRLVADAAKAGLSEIGRSGDTFDPRGHDSLNQIAPTSAEVVVKNVIRPGYVLNGIVLRSAEVEIKAQE